MKKQFLPYIVDPLTYESFEMTTFEEKNGSTMSGILATKKSWYPIINGIPRILIKDLKVNLLQTRHEFYKIWKKKLPKEIQKEWQNAIDQIKDFDTFLKHQKSTAESFAYEWENIYKENDYEKNNFLHFISPYIKEKDLKGKLILDVGCGSGRFTKWGALCGSKVVFGTDLGESVEVAYKMTKGLDNVCIVQSDIYAMPFKHVFDIAYSIGVLHHLPKPQEGFSKLPPTLKKGGSMLIWVYNRRGNVRAIYFYEPARAILKHLPKPLLYKLCYIPGGIVHAINSLTHGLNALGAKGLAKKMPFSYYANFPFNMKLNDAFDVLATPKSNYYFREEVEQWYKKSNLKKIRSFEHIEAGITCIGVR